MKTITSRTVMRWIVAGLLACASPLSAVELSPSGEGDALVYPIWATTNGHLSVLSVVDSHPRRVFGSLPAQAVKLLVRDARGELLFGANLYLLNGEDTWAASIVSQPNGRSRLASSDDSCVLIGEPGAVVPWSGSVELDADHGFIEMIVMGTIGSGAGDGSCTGLATSWNSGVWSQDPASAFDESSLDAAVRGTLNLVNVQKGTSYTIPATALREFSDISQHTAPSSALPDLASAHDSGTADNATRSRSCDGTGCMESTWTLPRNAVAAALLVEAVNGEYTRSSSLAGKSDLVFSYPLRHHFEKGTGDDMDSPRVDLATFDRSGMFRGGYICCVCPSAAPPHGCSYTEPWMLDFEESVIALSFLLSDDSSSLLPSEVLGVYRVHLPSFSLLPSAEGTFISRQFGALTSNEGHVHTGLPVIGVVLQQFENGNLIGADGVPQRANYGVALPMTGGTP